MFLNLAVTWRTTQRWQNVGRCFGSALMVQAGKIKHPILLWISGNFVCGIFCWRWGSVLPFKILRATLVMSVSIPDPERWTVARKIFRCKDFVFWGLRNTVTGICVPNFCALGCFVLQSCHLFSFQSQVCRIVWTVNYGMFICRAACLVDFIGLRTKPLEHSFLTSVTAHLPRRFLLQMQSALVGAFAELRKATVSFVMTVWPSVRPSAWNNSAPPWQIFMKLAIWVFFEYLSRKFEFLWSPTRIAGTLHEDQ